MDKNKDEEKDKDKDKDTIVLGAGSIPRRGHSVGCQASMDYNCLVDQRNDRSLKFQVQLLQEKKILNISKNWLGREKKNSSSDFQQNMDFFLLQMASCDGPAFDR